MNTTSEIKEQSKAKEYLSDLFFNLSFIMQDDVCHYDAGDNYKHKIIEDALKIQEEQVRTYKQYYKTTVIPEVRINLYDNGFYYLNLLEPTKV